jgi:hypothetical protein
MGLREMAPSTSCPHQTILEILITWLRKAQEGPKMDYHLASLSIVMETIVVVLNQVQKRK